MTKWLYWKYLALTFESFFSNFTFIKFIISYVKLSSFARFSSSEIYICWPSATGRGYSLYSFALVWKSEPLSLDFSFPLSSKVLMTSV